MFRMIKIITKNIWFLSLGMGLGFGMIAEGILPVSDNKTQLVAITVIFFIIMTYILFRGKFSEKKVEAEQVEAEQVEAEQPS